MVQADGSGRVEGVITIPPDVPEGTRLVEIAGEGGSAGSATYTGSSVIETRVLRRVTTITRSRGVDPLAQTFVLPQGRHVAGVDLRFTTKGAAPVRVQIRETSVGIPNEMVLAEGEIAAAAISLAGDTRIQWTPVWLEQDREYAIVVMTDDPEHAVAIAEIGQWDAAQNTWITGQPYQVGVLLSSSNASTWTPHQDRDLYFRLLAARFIETDRTVDLGPVSCEETSDLLAMAGIENTGANTGLALVLEEDGGDVVSRIQAGSPVHLAERLTGAYRLRAELTGDEIHSPVLYPGVQLALGRLGEEGGYITRAIPTGAGARIAITYEALLPGASSVTVSVQQPDDTWLDVPLQTATQVGDGWEERTHTLANFTGTTTRVRLNLAGTPAHRPAVAKLRVVAAE